jgi:hypothetical protein
VSAIRGETDHGRIRRQHAPEEGARFVGGQSVAAVEDQIWRGEVRTNSEDHDLFDYSLATCNAFHHSPHRLLNTVRWKSDGPKTWSPCKATQCPGIY